MNEQKITVKCECVNCGATGVYTHSTSCFDGAALVCRNCKGKGYIELSYTPFTERKPVPAGIKRIFKSEPLNGPYYGDDHTFSTGATIYYSRYGCTAEEWENGIEPKN